MDTARAFQIVLDLAKRRVMRKKKLTEKERQWLIAHEALHAWFFKMYLTPLPSSLYGV